MDPNMDTSSKLRKVMNGEMAGRDIGIEHMTVKATRSSNISLRHHKADKKTLSGIIAAATWLGMPSLADVVQVALTQDHNIVPICYKRVLEDFTVDEEDTAELALDPLEKVRRISKKHPEVKKGMASEESDKDSEGAMEEEEAGKRAGGAESDEESIVQEEEAGK